MGIRAATLIAALSSAICMSFTAQAFETSAKSAIVLDLGTDLTLMEKNADMALPPASMSKLMTLNMTFEALEDGRLSLDQRLPVSEAAQAYGGSTMFLNTRDRVSVEDLIRGVIVLSGNDASAVLAEAISPDGTERGFAQMMTERAQDLGMTNSTFANSNGWPAPAQRMSMRDLAILAKRLIQVFPQYYGYFAETEFAYDNRAPDNRFNRNPLLKLNIGADGLKTGHTSEAGYGLVGSAKQGTRRIVFVMSGLGTQQDRASESERIANWAFRQFAEQQLAEQGVIMAEAEVWMGTAAKVGLAATEDIKVLVPVLKKDSVTAKIKYRGPLEAPIKAGDKIAELIINVPGIGDATHDLVATETIDSGGFMVRIRTAATVLFRQLTGQAATFF
ncbi:D-alanyl-D-alanine carboxypeptidase (penicillin-binding protein 5/6) [Litoreibacter meonggei]|uniref:serine-type D-Ala-D-Ala carboxypeptidase n=1 Tax=Litoreibacter meonggei TaxID=1049199 RepID=A0A497X4J1_9RHOB|nr:D-alanyl-D-alanine carboxypeptidase family protein [Litoreibacter meonggei]RLJ60136.1 D-alanyl-D-alanine carboxypeptidase (penicillin-binding protein 5/6) [Litoreibacter meonggei]